MKIALASMKTRKAWIDLADALVPTGTSLLLSRNCSRLFLISCRLLAGPDEVRSITPHAMQDDRQLLRHVALGLFGAYVFPLPVTPDFDSALGDTLPSSASANSVSH